MRASGGVLGGWCSRRVISDRVGAIIVMTLLQGTNYAGARGGDSSGLEPLEASWGLSRHEPVWVLS